jgi:hypothetical protein
MMIGYPECRMGMCSVVYVEVSFFSLTDYSVLTIQIPDSGVGILSTALCLS